MPPRRRAARARDPAEPLPGPPPGIYLSEASVVAALNQLHIHVHLSAAAGAAASAPGAPSSGPREDPVVHLSPSCSGFSSRCVEADIRYYVVWHLPGHPGIHG
eukprot:14663323-Heterocapsa_arctica.AAC.1